MAWILTNPTLSLPSESHEVECRGEEVPAKISACHQTKGLCWDTFSSETCQLLDGRVLVVVTRSELFLIVLMII